ncbi:MAG TPA: CBS domain-containing protein [Nitrosopumilaceae archaeon]|nr:CBS domain-containing protein [Nitrosopumilaceae archaeon]
MDTKSTKPQLWIKEIIDNSILSVNSNVSALEAAKLMESSDIGAIIVLENQIPVGMVTNKDLTVKIIAHSYPADTPIRRIMSTPLISINPKTDINTAAEIMSSKKIRKLPIINDDEVIGIVIASDISVPIQNQQ